MRSEWFASAGEERPARVGRIVLAGFWLIDGLLKLQPYFFHHFAAGVIDASAAGQPGLIGHPITWFGGIVGGHQAVFVVLAALGECSIGIGLLMPRTVRPALMFSFAWALNVWLTGEGLGGLLTTTTPTPLTGIIGTAPLYIVAGLLVWPRSGAGADRGFGLLGNAGARAVWAALWLGAAALWLFPSNTGAGNLEAAITGAPSGAGWLSSFHTSVAGLLGGSGMTVTFVLAVLSAEVALSVVWIRGARLALLVSIAISLVFWTMAEGFGGILTGQATDVGTGPLMILIACLLLPLATPASTARATARSNGRQPVPTGT